MTGHEIRRRDEIRRTNRLRPEAQMRNRDGPGFLRVINEVALRIIVGVLADDLDGFLVRADRAVRAEPVEQRAHHLRRFDRKFRVHREARVAHIVHDADREMILRLRDGEIVEHGLDHRRGEFLRGQTVATADNFGRPGELRRPVGSRFREGIDHIEIQRLAVAPGSLVRSSTAIALDRGRQRGDEAIHIQRTIQPDFQHPRLRAAQVQRVHRLMHRFATGAHQDDHALRIRRHRDIRKGGNAGP